MDDIDKGSPGVALNKEQLLKHVVRVQGMAKRNEKKKMIVFVEVCEIHVVLLFSLFHYPLIYSHLQLKTTADLVFGLDCMPASVIVHGGQTIREKEEAMAVFSSGRVSMLVVPSAVSRGLNITVPVNLVINYDLPRHVQDFYERVCKYPTLIYKPIQFVSVSAVGDI